MASNVASGKTYTESPAASGSYPDTGGTELTDGANLDVASWTPYCGWNNTNPTIVVDCSSNWALSYVRFACSIWHPAGIYEPTQVVVSGSQDNTNWTALGTFVVNTDWTSTSPGVQKPVWSNDLSVSGTYRYIKFAFTCASSYWVFLGEVEVYGDSPDVTVTPSALTLSLTIQTPNNIIDALVEPSALALTLAIQSPTIPLSRSYLYFDTANKYYSLFIDNIEVFRIESDGTIKAKGAFTDSSL